ncbi:hypothetical protein ACVCFZ_12730 [Acinetobacter variabilis]|uniref:hypothetical protein n=1 Tax=Acinetobacter variabilis TaxID=70346 RepID=UPI0035D44DB5
MSDFEKWFEDQDFYTNMRFIHGDKLFDKDGGAYRVLPVQMTYLAWLVGRAAIQEMDEVIKLQDADLRKYEKQIEGLKAQLNNMEACCIHVKKERDELQGRAGEALEEIQRASNCCESAETACVLGEVKEILRGES